MPNPILKDGGIHHVALRVKDFEASLRFYTTVLGFVERVRWNEPPKRIVLLDTGNGSYLELFENGQNAPSPRTPSGTWPSACPTRRRRWSIAARPAARCGSSPRRLRTWAAPALTCAWRSAKGRMGS
jgi:catechol 2,3-dioxygenase-like lactoylglutathione lyase family enzyme